MELSSVHRNYKRLIHDNLSFIYQGNFTDDITEQLIGLSELNLENMKTISKLKRKASFLMIECFQNVIRHGERIEDLTVVPSHDGLYMTRNIGNKYYIASANTIPNSFIPELEEKLNTVNSLTKEQLKQHYLEILTNDSISEKGGAGLGLIEMARKSGKPLNYVFDRIDEEKSYFYMQVVLEKQQDIDCEIPVEPIEIGRTQDFNMEMKTEETFMIHKGNFSEESVTHVLQLIEQNLADQIETNTHKKRVFQALVELLQNVSKHCKIVDGLKEGVFQMGKRDGIYSFATGNIVEESEKDAIVKQLEEIIAKSQDERKDAYLKSMQGDQQSGFGLMDVSRYAHEIQYDFHTTNDGATFFALMLRI